MRHQTQTKNIWELKMLFSNSTKSASIPHQRNKSPEENQNQSTNTHNPNITISIYTIYTIIYNLYYIKTISNITKYQNTHNRNITRREKAKIILVSNNYQASRSRSTGCNTAAGRSGVSRKVQLHTGTIIYLLCSFSSFTFHFFCEPFTKAWFKSGRPVFPCSQSRVHRLIIWSWSMIIDHCSQF